MLRIAIRDTERGEYFFAYVPPSWARRHDNGNLISCGLSVGEHGFTRGMMEAARRNHRVEAISFDDWDHSGCQSSCVRRGGATCRW